MRTRRGFGLGMCFLAGMLSLVTVNAGCSLEESIVDGFYGGISGTIAALVTEATLGVVSSGTP